MSDDFSVRWVRVTGREGTMMPRLTFSGLLVPYLHFTDMTLVWSDPSQIGFQNLFLRDAVIQGAFSTISATRLEKITGVPAQFWRPSLLALESAGLLAVVDDEPQDATAGGVTYRLVDGAKADPAALDEWDHISTRIRVIRDVLVFPETGELMVSTGNPNHPVDRFMAFFLQTDPKKTFDWFSSVLPRVDSAESLKSYLTALGAASPPVGVPEQVTNLDFRITGGRPRVAPVRAVSGIFDTTRTDLQPFLTRVLQENEKGLWFLPPGAMTIPEGAQSIENLHGLPAMLRRRLDQCQSDEVISAARRRAPKAFPQLSALALTDPYCWTIDGTTTSPYVLEVHFSEVRIRIGIPNSTAEAIDAVPASAEAVQ
ncbi:hypothetical protein MED193_00660 [Roseobacter sp. MED193]|uniref:hypothetical protein n=1 Tax=Roseobacter sp. MED193 TaxID=314262 RepID=UPI000068A045|nr:hypothetical protein [Roseobacter sp. MED193]EAQ44004.1 hypothetical protein MED193_00660 [Roseobacter sp. MED193]